MLRWPDLPWSRLNLAEQSIILFCHPVQAVFAYGLSCLQAKCPKLRPVRKQPQKVSNRTLNLSNRKLKSAYAILNDPVGDSRQARGDWYASAGHRLDQGDRIAFILCWKEKDVVLAHKLGHIFRSGPASEVDSIREPRLGEPPLEFCKVWSISTNGAFPFICVTRELGEYFREPEYSFLIVNNTAVRKYSDVTIHAIAQGATGICGSVDSMRY